MQIMKLTRFGIGTETFVNLEKITEVNPTQYGSLVVFDDGRSAGVVEAPFEILERMVGPESAAILTADDPTDPDELLTSDELAEMLAEADKALAEDPEVAPQS